MSSPSIQKNIILSPVAYLLRFFPSQAALGNFLGITRGAISHWTKPISKGGTGGRVPAGKCEKYHRRIVEAGYMTYEQLHSESLQAALEEA